MARLKLSLSSAAAAAATLMVASGVAAQSRESQPPISQRVKDTITVEGLVFKDLNGDGALAPYEDWRLAAGARAEDLVARMTTEEKIGLMVIGTQTMGRSSAAAAPGGGPGRGCPGPVSDDGLLCEARVVTTTNIWAAPDEPNSTYPQPVVRTEPTTLGIQNLGIRRFIIRENPDPVALTEWTNAIQQVAEGSRLGIPVVMTSNPRNHATSDLAFGFTEASGAFSAWPGTLGLAASRDVRLVHDFARIAASEWNATGVRAGYMYMADLATDPRWFRIDGTFGDDPVLVSAMMEAVVQGFQGPELGLDGVLLTTKHFPGGGPRDRGSDPHYIYGKASPYPTPGSLFQFHLPPFAAAIQAGTAAIMPYYAVPLNERSAPQLAGGARFEEVGFAYNRAIIQDLLRTQMGFEGYVNSDSGILFSMPWGDRIEPMDYAERAAYAINAGVDVISDMQDVAIIRTAFDRGLISEARIDLSARRLLAPIFSLGLFENPYRDPQAAQALVDTPAHWARAYAAHQQSVVTLKNDDLLPLTDARLAGRAIYVQVLGANDRTDAVIETLRRHDPSVTFTRNLDEAGLALVFIDPSDRTDRRKESYFDLEVHAATGVDTERLSVIQAAVPTIVSINLEMPWLLGTVEPHSTALVAGFSTRADAVLDVLRGRVPSVGHLPLTLPRNIGVVIAAESVRPGEVGRATGSDVPGFERPMADDYVYRDTSGAEYRTGFGLTF